MDDDVRGGQGTSDDLASMPRHAAGWIGAVDRVWPVCGGPVVVSRTQGSHFVPTYTRMREGDDMARGRKTSLTIRLTPAERQTLLAWQRSTTISAGLARRGRIGFPEEYAKFLAVVFNYDL